jgi:hypothetical protein
MMTLTGTAEDQQPGRQRETGPAKKKSHNASHSNCRASGGARMKAEPEERNVQRSLVEGMTNDQAADSRKFGRRWTRRGCFQTARLPTTVCKLALLVALRLADTFPPKRRRVPTILLGMKLKGLSLGLL